LIPFFIQVVELDELADGSKVQEALATVTGRRTVPQVGSCGQRVLVSFAC